MVTDRRHPDRWGAAPIPERVLRRIFLRAEPGWGGCILSTYSIASHGYAQVGWQMDGEDRRDATTAHRVAWTAVNGPIPIGMTMDHICRVRRCINPRHLRLLDNVTNARDNGMQRGTHPLSKNRVTSTSNATQ